MATDQVITAKDVLDAVTRVRRMGVERLLQELEQQEPDLAEIVLEEASLIHQRMTSTGIPAKISRRLIRRIESLVLVAVAAVRQGHRRLWDAHASDLPSKPDKPIAEELKPSDKQKVVAESVVSMSQMIELHVDRRELATILAALRFHQDENLQGSDIIADQEIGVVATDGGKLAPLDFDEVEHLCERLNGDNPMKERMNIEPPPRESGEEQLFRVVYVIDVNAANARQAAEDAHHIMSDPASMAPILHILDHAGKVTTIDLTRGADPAATE